MQPSDKDQFSSNFEKELRAASDAQALRETSRRFVAEFKRRIVALSPEERATQYAAIVRPIDTLISRMGNEFTAWGDSNAFVEPSLDPVPEWNWLLKFTKDNLLTLTFLHLVTTSQNDDAGILQVGGAQIFPSLPGYTFETTCNPEAIMTQSWSKANPEFDSATLSALGNTFACIAPMIGLMADLGFIFVFSEKDKVILSNRQRHYGYPIDDDKIISLGVAFGEHLAIRGQQSLLCEKTGIHARKPSTSENCARNNATLFSYLAEHSPGARREFGERPAYSPEKQKAAQKVSSLLDTLTAPGAPFQSKVMFTPSGGKRKRGDPEDDE